MLLVYEVEAPNYVIDSNSDTCFFVTKEATTHWLFQLVFVTIWKLRSAITSYVGVQFLLMKV